MTDHKLNILHLFENYLPESQNWAFRMINNMEDTEINVCALEYSNTHFVTPKIKLVDLPDYVSPELFVEGGERSFFLYDKAINKLKRKTNSEKFIVYLAEQAKRLKIDMIHCHFANVGWNFLKLKEVTGLPFVVSLYGFDYESLPYTFPVWAKRYQELFNTADLFICEGPFGASILKSKGCDEKKIKINRLGVQLNRIPFLKREKKENELSLVQISNFFQKKGQIYTLQAFVQAVRTCPNLTLTLVGSDIDNAKVRLQKIVEENNLQDKVSFLDFLDFSQLYEFMKSYHVFIQPSCYADNRDCEGGAPVVILDAEATGMPIIATTHCDIPEEVVHKKTGLLSPEKNVMALTESIVRFYLMDNETYQSYANAAREHVENKFDAQKNSSSLKAIYLEYLKKLASFLLLSGIVV